MMGILKQSNLLKKKFMLLLALFIVLASSAYADVTGHVTVNWTNLIFSFHTGEICIADTSIFGTFDKILIEYSKDDHTNAPQPSQDTFALTLGNKWCSDLNGNLWDSSPTADTLASAKIFVKNVTEVLFEDNAFNVDVPNNLTDTNHTFFGGAPQPKLPTVNINSLLNNSNITSQDFNLTFTTNNWAVGGKGSAHIHLHISNQSGLSFSDQLMFYSAPNNVVELNLIPGPTKFATWMASDNVRFNNLSYGGHTLRAVLVDEFHLPPSNPEADQFINIFVDTCVDNDGDGFDGFDANSCPVGNDCDDTNNAVHPGASDAVCDGIDNDCDLQIDEDYIVTPTNCGIGVCAANGQLQCVNGSEQDTCTPGTPSSEVCDSLDNDCDGSVDENIVRSCYTGLQGTEGVGVCSAGTETCTSGSFGSCEGEVTPSAEVCDASDNDCDGSVDEGGNALCDDKQFCNGAEVCSGVNGCQAGTPPSTSDGIACTDDRCDETNNVIIHTPNDVNCDNGLFCDGAETCDATLDCQAGTPIDCDDGVSCTVDSCDEQTDSCDTTPNDSLCDNGLFCDGVEICDAINDCQAGTAIDCSANNIPGTDTCTNIPDNNSMTIDLRSEFISTCNEATDSCKTGDQTITHTCALSCGAESGCDGVAPGTGECTEQCVLKECTSDVDCDDGLFCNGAETCDLNTFTCQPGTPPTVDDGVRCTIDSCEEVNDTIIHTLTDSLCLSDTVCADYFCDAQLDCQVNFEPSTTECRSSAGACDVAETCTGSSADCPSDQFQPDGTSCSDTQFCNGDEICSAGVCQPGSAVDCSANNIQGIDTCNNIPDNNSATFDFRQEFLSICDENTDLCTISPIVLTHTCNILVCSAECENDAQCPDTDCDNLDGCVGNDYHDFDDAANSCTQSCGCEQNACGAPTIFVNDSRCLVAICGNGVLESGEQCDDSNTLTEVCDYGLNSCIVCASDCTEQAGVTSYCGDGILHLDKGEQCDDGNTVSGDGCSSACLNESIQKINQPIIGNSSDINSTTINPVVEINGSTNLSQKINGENHVKIIHNNDTILEFDFNFSLGTLYLNRIKVEKQNSSDTAGSLIIKGINLTEGKTKTLHVDNINNLTTLCIKDSDITSISQISSLCNGADEFGISCSGTANNDKYNCTFGDITNSTFKITGLDHSGIQQQSYCGDGIVNDGESCSNCPADAGTCPAPPPSPSGGGGGGSGGGGGVSGASFTCNMDWKCGEWSSCEKGWETRECSFVKVPQHTSKEECPSIKNVPTRARKCEIEETSEEIKKQEKKKRNETKAIEPQKPDTTQIPTGFAAITGAAIQRVLVNPDTVKELKITGLIIFFVLGILGYQFVYIMGGPDFIAKKFAKMSLRKTRYHQKKAEKLHKKGLKEKADKHYKKAKEFEEYSKK